MAFCFRWPNLWFSSNLKLRDENLVAVGILFVAKQTMQLEREYFEASQSLSFMFDVNLIEMTFIVLLFNLSYRNFPYPILFIVDAKTAACWMQSWRLHQQLNSLRFFFHFEIR